MKASLVSIMESDFVLASLTTSKYEGLLSTGVGVLSLACPIFLPILPL